MPPGALPSSCCCYGVSDPQSPRVSVPSKELGALLASQGQRALALLRVRGKSLPTPAKPHRPVKGFPLLAPGLKPPGPFFLTFRSERGNDSPPRAVGKKEKTLVEVFVASTAAHRAGEPSWVCLALPGRGVGGVLGWHCRLRQDRTLPVPPDRTFTSASLSPHRRGHTEIKKGRPRLCKEAAAPWPQPLAQQPWEGAEHPKGCHPPECHKAGPATLPTSLQHLKKPAASPKGMGGQIKSWRPCGFLLWVPRIHAQDRAKRVGELQPPPSHPQRI